MIHREDVSRAISVVYRFWKYAKGQIFENSSVLRARVNENAS
jgi:hypothetical protein